MAELTRDEIHATVTGFIQVVNTVCDDGADPAGVKLIAAVRKATDAALKDYLKRNPVVEPGPAPEPEPEPVQEPVPAQRHPGGGKVRFHFRRDY